MSDVAETLSIEPVFYLIENLRPDNTGTWDVVVEESDDGVTITETVNAIQAVKGFDYFFTAGTANPTPDKERPIDSQKLKFYPAFDVVNERAINNVTWDADDFTGANKQKVLGLDYFLASATNPLPDKSRQIDDQKIKFYTNFDVTFHNPPTIYGWMKIKPTITAKASNDPEELLETLFIEDNYIAAGGTEIDTIITKLKITTFLRDADGGVVPDPKPDPNPDYDADVLEQLNHYINIKSMFATTETTNYRDVFAAATWFAHTTKAYANIKEKVKIKFYESNEELNPNAVDTTVKISDFLKISTQETKNILEFVRISDFYRAEGGTSEEEHTTYVINEDNETTRYEHWPFEGYASFKGVHFGCGPDGIYELTGDDDNGEPIAAMINFGKQSFGSSQLKRVPYVYASLASDGDLYMQVSYTDDNVYMYPARKVDEYNATVRFDLGRGIKANYLNFELYNENGSKFDLRNVWIYLTELSRRI